MLWARRLSPLTTWDGRTGLPIPGGAAYLDPTSTTWTITYLVGPVEGPLRNAGSRRSRHGDELGKMFAGELTRRVAHDAEFPFSIGHVECEGASGSI